MSDEVIRDFEARLEQRLAQHGRGRLLRETRRDLQQYEEWLQARLTADRQARAARAATRAPGLPAAQRLDLQGVAALRRLDRLLWDTLGLGDFFPYRPFADYPIVYCETLEDFFRPLVEMFDVSERTRREYLEALVRQAEEGARRGTAELGYNLPGHGCYLNGWFFAQGRAADARAALSDPAIFPWIVSTAVHERLGHGFLATFTRLGQEETRAGLLRYDIARRFQLRTTDTPQGELLAEKSEVIHRTSLFYQEGWATWITQALVEPALQAGIIRSRPELPTGGFTAPRVGELLARLRAGLGEEARAARVVLEALTVLLGREAPAEEQIHAAMRAWQELAPLLDPAFCQALGQGTPYVLGFLLLQRLEGGVGARGVPYALALAGNLTYGLEEMAVSDLRALAAEKPRLNADTRLALLCRLVLERPGDVAELGRRAREELNLAVPEGWPAS